MFVRLRWLLTGAGLGAGGAVWLNRQVRRRIDRYRPPAVVARVGAAGGRLRGDVAGALGDGRAAMRARHDELQRRVDAVVSTAPEPAGAQQVDR